MLAIPATWQLRETEVGMRNSRSSIKSDGVQINAPVLATQNILLVSDTPAVRMMFYSLAKRVWVGSRIALACTVSGAQRVIAAQHIDIAILDMDWSIGSGTDLLRRIANQHRSAVSVAISYDDDLYLEALAVGAFGYLLKDQKEALLSVQLRLLKEGIPPFSPVIAQKLLGHLVLMENTCPNCGAGGTHLEETVSRRLTSRETEVLALIAKGMHVTEVANELSISANTVGGYMKSIYRKRKVNSRAKAALEARKLGLV